MADENSPGEIIDEIKVASVLADRLWECECAGKEARLTAESVRYVSTALRYYILQCTSAQPFQHMHFHLEEWPYLGRSRVVLRSESLTMAHAAFDAGVAEYKNSYLTMRHGMRVVRDSRVEKAAAAAKAAK